MKKVLEKIRSKSPEFRLMVAVILAAVMTILIGILWGVTFSRGTKHVAKDAPTPFNALTGSIKGVIQNQKTDQKDLEIIDNSETPAPAAQ